MTLFVLVLGSTLIVVSWWQLREAARLLAEAERRIREAQRLAHQVDVARKDMHKTMTERPIEDWQLKLIWAAMRAGVELPEIPPPVRQKAGLS